MTISGNLFGVDPTGELARPNGGRGIYADSLTDSSITGNQVSGNAQEGVFLTNGSTLTIQGNLVGTDDDGGSTVTITDDDTAPSITVADPTAIGEGNTGTQNLTFTVALSAPSGLPVQVAYQTEAVEARSNIDYMAQPPSSPSIPGRPRNP